MKATLTFVHGLDALIESYIPLAGEYPLAPFLYLLVIAVPVVALVMLLRSVVALIMSLRLGRRRQQS